MSVSYVDSKMANVPKQIAKWSILGDVRLGAMKININLLIVVLKVVLYNYIDLTD